MQLPYFFHTIKHNIKVISTFLLHSTCVKGWGVVIKKSKVAKKNCSLYKSVWILNSNLKENVTIHDNSKITYTTFEGYNKIGANCGISDSLIGSFSYINDYSSINNVTIGKFCSIGPNLKVGYGVHPTSFISTSPILYSTSNLFNLSLVKEQSFKEFKKTYIGNDVWIGANVFISEGIIIGDGAILGASSVITKDVPDYGIVGGVPAKIIRYRFAADVITKLKKSAWWNKDLEWLRKNAVFFQRPILNIDDLKDLF